MGGWVGGWVGGWAGDRRRRRKQREVGGRAKPPSEAPARARTRPAATARRSHPAQPSLPRGPRGTRQGAWPAAAGTGRGRGRGAVCTTAVSPGGEASCGRGAPRAWLPHAAAYSTAGPRRRAPPQHRPGPHLVLPPRDDAAAEVAAAQQLRHGLGVRAAAAAGQHDLVPLARVAQQLARAGAQLEPKREARQREQVLVGGAGLRGEGGGERRGREVGGAADTAAARAAARRRRGRAGGHGSGACRPRRRAPAAPPRPAAAAPPRGRGRRSARC
jgi:hypothetical protein